jgi:hypothetical protein
LSPQRGDNLGVWKNIGELDHTSQVLLPEPATVAGLQLSPHCGDNLGAVLGTPPLEYLRADMIPELPVQRGQRGVRGDGDLLARSLDYLPTRTATWPSSSAVTDAASADGSFNALGTFFRSELLANICLTGDETFFSAAFAGFLRADLVIASPSVAVPAGRLHELRRPYESLTLNSVSLYSRFALDHPGSLGPGRLATKLHTNPRDDAPPPRAETSVAGPRCLATDAPNER